MIFRCVYADFIKIRYTSFLMLHFLFPILGAVVFAGYFNISNWSPDKNISAFLEIVAVVFPVFIGISVSQMVDLEFQAGNFQVMLSTIPSKVAVYLGKIILFFMLETFSCLFCLLLFACLYQPFPIIFYIRISVFLIVSNISIYLVTLFFGLAFGSSFSIVTGIFGALVSALMITGLGDKIWKVLPWAWGVRFMDYSVLAYIKPNQISSVKVQYDEAVIYMITITLIIFVLLGIWFKRWEKGN